jgi:hypothetical protein
MRLVLSSAVRGEAARHSPKREPRPTGERAGLGGTLIETSSGKEGSQQGSLDPLAYTDLTAATVLRADRSRFMRLLCGYATATCFYAYAYVAQKTALTAFVDQAHNSK